MASEPILRKPSAPKPQPEDEEGTVPEEDIVPQQETEVVVEEPVVETRSC